MAFSVSLFLSPTHVGERKNKTQILICDSPALAAMTAGSSTNRTASSCMATRLDLSVTT